MYFYCSKFEKCELENKKNIMKYCKVKNCSYKITRFICLYLTSPFMQDISKLIEYNCFIAIASHCQHYWHLIMDIRDFNDDFFNTKHTGCLKITGDIFLVINSLTNLESSFLETLIIFK